MRSLINLILLGFSLAPFVSSLPPYIEHVDGHQGYRKNASGHFVLDEELVPTTNGGHVILPTRTATDMASIRPDPTTAGFSQPLREDSTIADRTASFNIKPRTLPEPPTIAHMKIFLRIVKRWDGTNCVFWDDRITGEVFIEQFARHALGVPGRWFKELYTDDTRNLEMADDWGRPGWPTHNHPWDESLRDKGPQVMARMMEALAETCKGDVFILIETGDIPGPQSLWSRHVEPELRRRQVRVRAYDCELGRFWDDNLLGINPANYVDP